jgi:16S rRNA (cytidine1402-2'-O)-methyltransferase
VVGVPGSLVVCGTPIGNLEDASPRLGRALAEADVVACEDTRRTRRLLDHFGVRARTISYHEFNERGRAEELAERIEAGERVALVSDAGMPAVSDPGYQLVKVCIARGLPIEVVPGPSAVVAALVLSGMPTDRFCFEGFLPRKAGARARRLAELAVEQRTMVFFESPHRIAATLAAMAEAFGAERRAALARELTKLHEEVVRSSLGELRDQAAGQQPRGELTLVVAGAGDEGPDGGRERGALAVTGGDPAELAGRVAELVAAGADSKAAIATVARASGAPKRTVYQAVLDARNEARQQR